MRSSPSVGSDYRDTVDLKSFLFSEFHHITGTAVFVCFREGITISGKDGLKAQYNIAQGKRSDTVGKRNHHLCAP